MPLFLCSAALHEAGHLAALYLLRVPVLGMELRGTGAVLHTGQMHPVKEAVCTAAGPLANALLLFAFFRRFPPLALVNLVLLVYNLLPIYPLDGGRLLRIAFCKLFGASAGEKASDALTAAVVLAAVAAAIVSTCFFHVGIYPCLLASVFLCRCANSPCKIRHRQLKWKQKKEKTEVCYD